METRRRADTRGHPPAGPDRGLPRSPAGCRGPARLAARPAAPPPHMGPRRHIGGSRRPRSGPPPGLGGGRWPAQRREPPAGPARPPATRKCLLAAASLLHPGPRLPRPAPGGAAPGGGDGDGGLRRPGADRGASASSSLTRSPAGRRGQAVPGRLWRRGGEGERGVSEAALGPAPAPSPLTLPGGSQVPGPESPAAGSARAASALRAGDTRIHTHRGTRPGGARRMRGAGGGGGGRAPPMARGAAALARMPGAGRAAQLSRDLAPPPPRRLSRERASRGNRAALAPLGGGRGRFRARGPKVASARGARRR